MTGFLRANHKHSDLWRVSTPSSVTIQHFKAINGILNIKIRVEVLKRPPVPQCKNCQLFFHSAAGCHRKYRCVKCVTDHPPAKCPRNENKSLPVACCNCLKNQRFSERLARIASILPSTFSPSSKNEQSLEQSQPSRSINQTPTRLLHQITKTKAPQPPANPK